MVGLPVGGAVAHHRAAVLAVDGEEVGELLGREGHPPLRRGRLEKGELVREALHAPLLPRRAGDKKAVDGGELLRLEPA